MNASALAAAACACALYVAAPLHAQTAQTQPTAPGAAPQTLTINGCVTGGSQSQPFVLSNPVVVPTGQTPPGSVGTTGVAGSQPPTTPPAIPPATSPALPPGASPTPPSTPPSSAGVGGASGTSGSTPTVGSAASDPTVAGTAGTSGSATPGAVASGGTSAPIAGYRLSGSDMQPWSGQRVEIVGSLVKTNPAVSTGAGAAPAMPEFRVQSVRPVGGSCEPR